MAELVEEVVATRRQIINAILLFEEVESYMNAEEDIPKETQQEIRAIHARLQTSKEALDNDAALVMLEDGMEGRLQQSAITNTALDEIESCIQKHLERGRDPREITISEALGSRKWYESRGLVVNSSYYRVFGKGAYKKLIEKQMKQKSEPGRYSLEDQSAARFTEIMEPIRLAHKRLTHFHESLQGDDGLTTILRLKNRLKKITTAVAAESKLLHEELIPLQRRAQEDVTQRQQREFEAYWGIGDAPELESEVEEF